MQEYTRGVVLVKKSIRQERIERLINQYPIGTQEELMEHLEDVGIQATQATISRDIREMQILKWATAVKKSICVKPLMK